MKSSSSPRHKRRLRGGLLATGAAAIACAGALGLSVFVFHDPAPGGPPWSAAQPATAPAAWDTPGGMLMPEAPAAGPAPQSARQPAQAPLGPKPDTGSPTPEPATQR